MIIIMTIIVNEESLPVLIGRHWLNGADTLTHAGFLASKKLVDILLGTQQTATTTKKQKKKKDHLCRKR